MLSWYILSLGHDPTTKYNYEKIYSEPTCCGSEAICAIRAFDDGNNHPLITEQLKFEMIAALWNNVETSNVRLHYSCHEHESLSIICNNYLFNKLTPACYDSI